MVVVAGPDAGRWQRIAPGQRLIVGRDADGLRVGDPLLSARHCTFELTSPRTDATTVTCSSATPAARTARSSSATRSTDPGDRSSAPATSRRAARCSPSSPSYDDDLAVLGEPEGGAAVLPRQYRRALPGLPDRLDPPQAREPEKADHGNMWWRSVLPLVTGAGFALLTGRWIFLLIMAIAPIIFTYDALKRHRREARRHETAHAKYLAELNRYAEELTDLRRAERRRRREVSPPAASPRSRWPDAPAGCGSAPRPTPTSSRCPSASPCCRRGSPPRRPRR